LVLDSVLVASPSAYVRVERLSEAIENYQEERLWGVTIQDLRQI